MKAFTDIANNPVDQTKMVNIIIVANPLLPADSRQTSIHEWGNAPLTHYVGNIVGNWVIQSAYCGQIQLEDAGKFTPMPGDYIVMVPLLQGGDSSGKDILRMAALIALSVYTGGIASGAFGVMGGAGAGAMSASTIATAVALQVGGTLLLNKILPVAKPKQDSASSEQVYGIDGPKNVSTEGIPFPLVYGEHWVGGNILSMFVDNVGSQQQYLNMLICLGEGEISSVEDIFINDQPISSYSDIITHVRYGTSDQGVIPYFNDIVTPNNRNVTLPRYIGTDWNSTEAVRQNALKSAWSAGYLTHVTTGAANRVRLDFLFPAGLGVQHNDGTYTAGKDQSYGVNFVIGYRESGSSSDFLPLGAWADDTLMENPYENGDLVFTGTFDPFSGYELADMSSEYQPGYTSQTGDMPRNLGVTVRGNSQSPVRKSYFTGELDPTKRYEFRMFNSQEDDLAITRARRIIMLIDVNEVRYEEIRYKHTALLGIRARMNDQLNSIPSVLSRIKGIKCQVYNENTRAFVTQWTQNPAWIAYDALTNSRYGAGVSTDKIKLAYFREWATYCAENDLKFNGAIPESSNVWDALMPVFRAGRARPIRSGTKYQVSIERLKSSSMMFTSGNIKKGSLSISWASLEDRANEVHVKYYDREDFNKPKTVIVQDALSISRGDDLKKTEIDLRGVDNVQQAAREGAFALNMNKLVQSVSFEAPIESIAVTLGDVFSVQHDMPNWGFGGLTAPGSNATLVMLDKPVTMAPGKTYELMVKHDVITEFQGSVVQILGNVVYFTGSFNPANHGRITRLVNVSTGEESSIGAVYWSGSAYGVELYDASIINVGSYIQLIDTDVIETKFVTLSVGTSTQVTLSSPLRATPKSYTGWAFGESGSVVKRFTCHSISGNGDLWRTISGIEYNPDALNDVPVNFSVPEQVRYDRITNVTFDGWTQSAVSSVGSPERIDLSFSWSSDSEIYDRAEVYVYKNDIVRFVGTYTNSASIEANEGELITVAIIPIDRYGRKPDLSLVDRHTHIVSDQFEIHSPENLSLVTELVRNSSGNYETNLIFTFEEPENTYHVLFYEVQYKLARRELWTSLSSNKELRHELRLPDTGIAQFRVRAIYVKGVSFSDWGYAEVASLGTKQAISLIGLNAPLNPKIYITDDKTKSRADIRVSVQLQADQEIVPEYFSIFYSADSIPNKMLLGADEGNKLRFAGVEIPQEFTLPVVSGSTLTKVRYADPNDFVDIDLSGMWWLSIRKPGGTESRWHKVSGATTSELSLPDGEELTFVPEVGDVVAVIEVAWHDSRLPEFRLAYSQGEVVRHNGIQFDGDYYLEVVERAAEGSVAANLSGSEIHYYPALGPDTTEIVIDMANFNLVDGVLNYSGTIDLKIPSKMAWSSITCCFARAATTEQGVEYVRSHILPLTVSGIA